MSENNQTSPSNKRKYLDESYIFTKRMKFDHSQRRSIYNIRFSSMITIVIISCVVLSLYLSNTIEIYDNVDQSVQAIKMIISYVIKYFMEIQMQTFSNHNLENVSNKCYIIDNDFHKS